MTNPNFIEPDDNHVPPGCGDGEAIESIVVLDSEVVFSNGDRAWQWLRRQKLRIALGSVAVSTGITFTNEFDQFKHQMVEAGPWVGSALAGLEAGWIGGAALMLYGIGSKVGNPLRIRSRIPEIAEQANNSRTFKTGLAINVAASLAESGVLGGGILSELPPEAWGFLSLPVVNAGSDIVITRAILQGMRRHAEVRQQTRFQDDIRDTVEPNHESERQPSIRVRQASVADVERLAEIDLLRYRKVYGDNPPAKEEVMHMFSRCITNAGPNWTYVCEVDGTIEGLVNGFKTRKTMDDFVSWEDCTADGTLDNRVDPDGEYVYVANLTVNPRAMKLGGEDMLMANLVAQAIQEGVEYGYWCSRMPIFSAWIKRQIRQGKIGPEISAEALDDLANQYANSMEVVDGNEVRTDYELRMYEELGFRMGRVVRDGFQDPPSMNYGVLFRADIPPKGIMKRSKLVRYGMAGSLRAIAKHPKVLEKLFG